MLVLARILEAAPEKLDHETYKQLRQYFEEKGWRFTPQAAKSMHQAEMNRRKRPVLDWNTDRHSEKKLTMQLEGFDITVRVAYDYDHDWCYFRGQFTNKWKEGAIDNPRARTDHSSCPYFVPDISEQEHYEGIKTPDISEADARKKAHEAVLQELRIAADPEEACMYAVYLVATASKADVELGIGSVGGLELSNANIDDNAMADREIDDAAWEVIHDAISSAKEHFNKLIDTVKL